MANPLQMELVNKHSQVLFCWTDEQNDRDTVKYLKQLGVNGVIYDRMDQNNEKLVKQSIFVSSKKLGCAGRPETNSSGISSSGSDYSPKSSPGSSPSHNFSGCFAPT